MKYDYYKEMKKDVKDCLADNAKYYEEEDKRCLLDYYENGEIDDFCDYLGYLLRDDGITDGTIYTEDAWSHICDNIDLLTNAIQDFCLMDLICETLKKCAFDFKAASLDFDYLLRDYILDSVLEDMIETEPETIIKYLK